MRSLVLAFIVSLSATLPAGAVPQPSAELERALAAADRARKIPEGEAYFQAIQDTTVQVVRAAMAV